MSKIGVRLIAILITFALIKSSVAADQTVEPVTDLNPLYKATADRLQAFGLSEMFICGRIRGGHYSGVLAIPEQMKAFAADYMGLGAWDKDRGKPVERPSFQFFILHPEVNRFSVTNYQIAPDDSQPGNPPHIAKAEVLLFDLDGKLVCRTKVPSRPGRPLVSEERVVAMIAELHSTDQSLTSILYIHHEALGLQGMIDSPSFNGELLLLDPLGKIKKILSHTVTWSSCQISLDGHYLAYLDGEAEWVDRDQGIKDYSKWGLVLADETGSVLFFQPRYASGKIRMADRRFAEPALGWPKETTPDFHTPRPVYVDNQGRVIMHGSMSFWIYGRTGKLIHQVPDEVYTGSPYGIAEEDVFAAGLGSRRGLLVLDLNGGRLLFRNAEIGCPSAIFKPEVLRGGRQQ